MKVKIQFDDKNRALAAAIGYGLMSYAFGTSLHGAAKLAKDLDEKAATTTKVEDLETTTTGPVGADPATLDEWIAKYGEPVDPSDWSRVPDHLIPAKEVFPGVDENAVADAIQDAGIQGSLGELNGAEDPGPETATDEHGVPFDGAYCAVSAEKPFYATGPRVGQWKKKRGLDVEEYDAWYAGEKAKLAAAPTEPGKVDTAAAFAADPGAGPNPATTDLPETPGDLMKWCAEQTAAGAITTAEVTAAYAACGITVADMFGPEGPDHVKAVLAVLVK